MRSTAGVNVDSSPRCGVVFPCVPSPITSPSAAEAARGGEREGRLRLDEEVLDAPEELRQPVVGVGGAQEQQGQERLALCTSQISQDSHVPWSSRGGTRVSSGLIARQIEEMEESFAAGSALRLSLFQDTSYWPPFVPQTSEESAPGPGRRAHEAV